jgi:hypothetical protein
VTRAIGFYRARVEFSFAHSILLAGYGRIVGYSETAPANRLRLLLFVESASFFCSVDLLVSSRSCVQNITEDGFGSF